MFDSDLLVGAFGWDNDTWQGSFYPNDLPHDWRLSFYSIKLRSVLVPYATWKRQGTEHIENWLEDLYSGFKMVFELPLDNASKLENTFVDNIDCLLEINRALHDYTGAYLLGISTQCDQMCIDSARKLMQYHPVCFCMSNGFATNDASLPQIIAGFGNCWRADEEASPTDAGDYLITITSTQDARTMRAVIESIQAWAENVSRPRQAALYFTGENAAENALQARLIAEMIGV